MCPLDDELSHITQFGEQLQDSGLMPEHGAAITSCPFNVDQTCLNLRDRDAPSESTIKSYSPLITSIAALKLEIRMPFLHNEVIDTRSSFVKISNVFIDTTDGNFFAQIEITSMDHFTKGFNLTFGACPILEQLHISHSIVLPPNKSLLVNLTMTLPLYTELKIEKCEGRYEKGYDVILMTASFLNSRRKLLFVIIKYCFITSEHRERRGSCRSKKVSNESKRFSLFVPLDL